MKFYIRTEYGESTSYVGGKENSKQGECQGNRATPAAWQRISTVMLRAHCKVSHGVTVTSPISKKTFKQSGNLYVYYTNPWAGLLAGDNLDAAIYQAQEGIDI